MSRYMKALDNGKDIAYGHDNTTGYFFQVFDNKLDDNGEEILLVDECSTFTKMQNKQMIDLMIQYQVDNSHISSVVLDLPF